MEVVQSGQRIPAAKTSQASAMPAATPLTPGNERHAHSGVVLPEPVAPRASLSASPAVSLGIQASSAITASGASQAIGHAPSQATSSSDVVGAGTLPSALASAAVKASLRPVAAVSGPLSVWARGSSLPLPLLAHQQCQGVRASRLV
uniref:Uncharacterized protein n=1 Tax=Sphaerodactylus townsendi TaxID=933632 RepID=A0ACB8G1T0_9SAUR